MSEAISRWSKGLAADLGERDGRSVSRRLADGLRWNTEADLKPSESMDLVHAGMIATAAAAASNPKIAGPILVAAGASAALLWLLGQNN